MHPKETSCTSTDLHNSTVQSTELGYQIQNRPITRIKQGKTQVSFENHHREAASRSSRRIKIPLKLAPRHQTHNLEKDFVRTKTKLEETTPQPSLTFPQPQLTTQHATKNSVETQYATQAQGLLAIHSASSTNTKFSHNNTSSERVRYSPLRNKRLPWHNLHSSNRHLQLSFPTNHPGNPARSGTSRPNAPTQCLIDTLPKFVFPKVFFPKVFVFSKSFFFFQKFFFFFKRFFFFSKNVEISCRSRHK